MNPEQTEKYTTCDRCGKEILEQCAIEDSGRFLCGDCVVKTTDSEVREAEKVVQQLRKEEYESQRKKILAKQRQRAVYIFIACLILFGVVQVFNAMNRPDPVKSIHIDLQKDLDTMKSIIVFALHSYQTEHQGQVPESLEKLFPNYLSADLQPYLVNFDYQKIDSGNFSIHTKEN